MAFDIEMTIDALRDIANRTMGSMKDQAQGTARQFGNINLPPGAFGGWEEGRRLGRHHQGAHEVFASTLEGVIADLEQFARNLRETADATEQREEAVEEGLLALGRGYRERTFVSDKTYTDTVLAVTGETVAPGELAVEAGLRAEEGLATPAEQAATADQPVAADPVDGSTTSDAGTSVATGGSSGAAGDAFMPGNVPPES